MPPRVQSRFTYCKGIRDDGQEGALQLTDRNPYGYRDLPDNREHTVVDGDTLMNLAGQYFLGIERPAGLWWVIADFQPEPIHDPTLRLPPGTNLVIPSNRTVLELIFNESRRNEP